MVRSRIVITVLSALLALGLIACGSSAGNAPSNETPTSTTASNDDTPKKRVAFLLPGLIDDQSVNTQIAKGMDRAKAEGIEIAYTERVTQDQQLEVFRNYARQGFDVVVGAGGEYQDAAKQAASEFPDTHFVVINGTEGEGNLTGLLLNYGDMGYMAGVLAAHMSETKQVAVVGALPIPFTQAGIEGFTAGAKSVSPDIEVKETLTGSFDDVAKAREAALALISSGVDVIWHMLDSADAGVLSAAEDEGILAIGLYADQSGLAPNAVIASVSVYLDSLAYIAATRDLEGKVYHFGAADPDVVKIGDFSDKVPEDVLEKVREAEEGLASGAITY